MPLFLFYRAYPRGDDFQGLSDCWPEKDDELQVSCPIRPGHLRPIVCAWFALRKSLGLQTETRFDPWAGAVGGDRTGKARLARIGVSQMLCFIWGDSCPGLSARVSGAPFPFPNVVRFGTEVRYNLRGRRAPPRVRNLGRASLSFFVVRNLLNATSI